MGPQPGALLQGPFWSPFPCLTQVSILAPRFGRETEKRAISLAEPLTSRSLSVGEEGADREGGGRGEGSSARSAWRLAFRRVRVARRVRGATSKKFSNFTQKNSLELLKKILCFYSKKSLISSTTDSELVSEQAPHKNTHFH